MPPAIKIAVGTFLATVGCCRFLPCDPGWSYRAVAATEVRDNGIRYDVPSPSGTKVRVYANLFTSNLMTEIEVTNLVDAPLSIEPAELSLMDAHGAPIAQMFPERVPRCEGKLSEPTVRLARGEVCKIHVDWAIQPDPKTLSSVRIEHRGLARDAGMVRLPIITLQMVD